MNRLIPVQHNPEPSRVADLYGVPDVSRRNTESPEVNQVFIPRKKNRWPQSRTGLRQQGRDEDREGTGDGGRLQLRSDGVQTAVTQSISSPGKEIESGRQEEIVAAITEGKAALFKRVRRDGWEFRIETGRGLGMIPRCGRTRLPTEEEYCDGWREVSAEESTPPREKEARRREKRSRN
jgi:hypothetical protein